MRRSGTGLGGWTPGGLVAGGGYNGGGFGYIQIVAPAGGGGGGCPYNKVSGKDFGRSHTKTGNAEKHI